MKDLLFSAGRDEEVLAFVDLSSEVTPLSSAEKSFQYRGDLAETALPEMLYTIDRFQVGGVVRAERDGVTKEVVIADGCVVHASSTDLNDSLGMFLLRSGTLSPTVAGSTMEERGQSDRRYGEILVEGGHLSPTEVAQAIIKHVEAIVWSLFYWQDGRVTFRIGEAAGANIRLPMRQVILTGIKRAPNAKALVARLGRRDALFEPCFEIENLIDAGLDAEQYELLKLVDGHRTLYEICTEGPFSAAENGKLMYAFQVLQLIRGVSVEENAGGEKAENSTRSSVKIRLKTPGGRFSA